MAHDGQEGPLGPGGFLGLVASLFQALLAAFFLGDVVEGPDHGNGRGFGPHGLAVQAQPDHFAVAALHLAFPAGVTLGDEVVVA